MRKGLLRTMESQRGQCSARVRPRYSLSIGPRGVAWPARNYLAANSAILKRLAEIDKTLLVHDSALRALWTKLQPLLSPPPEPPKPEIGFHVKEDSAPYRVKRRPVPA